ncbi:MAG: DUF2007 domain-containing protein [Pseudomonadota bacterium]
MKTIYRSTSIADIYLLRDLLAQAEIEAHVSGEYLRGAVGELPPDTPVSLTVHEAQAAAARDIVMDWERSRPVDEPDSDDTEAGVPAGPTSAGVTSTLFVLASLVFGAACGGAIVWAMHNHPGDGGMRDYDGDGRIDESVHLAGDRVDRVETDRNRDGRVDQVQRYRANGDLDRIELDDDFDGRLEGLVRYEANQPVEWRMDRNGDGAPEQREVYERGVLVREETLDNEARVVKTVRYRAGVPVSGEFDADGDGVLDTARTYDPRGEIVASGPLRAKSGK